MIIIIIIKMYTLQRKLELDGVNMVIFLVNVNTLGTFSSLIVYSFEIIFFPFPSFSFKEKRHNFFIIQTLGSQLKAKGTCLAGFVRVVGFWVQCSWLLILQGLWVVSEMREGRWFCSPPPLLGVGRKKFRRKEFNSFFSNSRLGYGTSATWELVNTLPQQQLHHVQGCSSKSNSRACLPCSFWRISSPLWQNLWWILPRGFCLLQYENTQEEPCLCCHRNEHFLLPCTVLLCARNSNSGGKDWYKLPDCQPYYALALQSRLQQAVIS